MSESEIIINKLIEQTNDDMIRWGDYGSPHNNKIVFAAGPLQLSGNMGYPLNLIHHSNFNGTVLLFSGDETDNLKPLLKAIEKQRERIKMEQKTAEQELRERTIKKLRRDIGIDPSIPWFPLIAGAITVLGALWLLSISTF